MSYEPHLQSLVDALRADPDIVHGASFSEFRALFESQFGARFPPPKTKKKDYDDDDKGGGRDAAETRTREKEDEEGTTKQHPIVDDPDVVGPESEPVPKRIEESKLMMDPNNGGALTEDEANAMIDAKSKASSAFAAGDYASALEYYTKALDIQPSALTFSKRAECFMKLKRNAAATQDCEQALKINPDSAKALKVLGTAQRYLGQYEEACKNLGQGLAIDFDEQSAKVEKEAEKFFHEIRVAKSKEKAKKEQEEKRKMEEERRKRAEEAMKNANAANNNAAGGPGGGTPGGGGFPNSGFPGGIPPGMEGMMNDPEIMAAMMNPKVMNVLQQAQTNPGALIAAMNDPEVGPLLNKIVAKMGGSMGSGGMGGGGMPDFANMGGRAGGGASAASSRFTEEDAPPRSATVDEVD